MQAKARAKEAPAKEPEPRTVAEVANEVPVQTLRLGTPASTSPSNFVSSLLTNGASGMPNASSVTTMARRQTQAVLRGSTTEPKQLLKREKHKLGEKQNCAI